MKRNALLPSSCRVLLHLVQGAKAKVAHASFRNSTVEKSAGPKGSGALHGLDHHTGHTVAPRLPRTKMPLNSVEVPGSSWWAWSIWIAVTHSKKKKGGGFLEAHFKLIAWMLKSKSSLGAFPDVFGDRIHDGANLSWWLAHRMVSA